MIHEAIARVFTRRDLTEEQMMAVMEEISEGQATPLQIGAMILALGMKGETPAEIAGVAKVLRARKVNVPLSPDGPPVLDTAGTGGDATGTFNVSTCAGLVAAGCGLRVAKHGNRSVSSRCGSADVMEALGVTVDMPPDLAARCIDEIGFGFLFAPHYHPAMRHAAHPRRELGLKSIFNLAGPLTNPADAPVQIVGVFRPDLTETMAKALRLLGSQSAIVVHGHDGCDEISLSGPTRVTRLLNGTIRTETITPDHLGLPSSPLETVRGGDAEQNAAIIRAILKGEKGPRRNVVLANSAAALLAAGAVEDLRSGVRAAAQAIDEGRALACLDRLVDFSRQTHIGRKAAGA